MDLNLDHIIDSVGGGRPARQTSSAASASRQLRRWWVAERAAPVLLAYQADLLAEVKAEIQRLRDHVENTSLSLLDDEMVVRLGDKAADLKIELLVIESELERVKYTARAYMRTRMAKIDQYRYYYLQLQDELLQDDRPGIMSRDEWIYCHHHAQLRADHYGSSFLQKLPEEFQELTEVSDQANMIDQPDMEKPVSIRALEPQTIVVGTEPVELLRNGIYLLRFSAIAEILDKVEFL